MRITPRLAVILLFTALVSLMVSLLLNESFARTSILGTNTCQSQRGASAGAVQNLGGNCNSNGNGFSNVAADDLESNSKACEIHGIQSPNNNVFLKVGCGTK